MKTWKKYLLIFIGIIIYFNIGFFYTESLYRNQYERFINNGDEKTFLFPKYLPSLEKEEKAIIKNMVVPSFSRFMEINFKEEVNECVFFILQVLWPIIMFIFTILPWIIVIIKFIFFGELVNFLIKNFNNNIVIYLSGSIFFGTMLIRIFRK